MKREKSRDSVFGSKLERRIAVYDRGNRQFGMCFSSLSLNNLLEYKTIENFSACDKQAVERDLTRETGKLPVGS
ncbi:hypothetical protein WH47_00742 [Habropoda laboriosa]|uniref:Uncharacterized protein n=1 Tax=Habropoda laboriosa TaxID=597456 RepID=A0A0L7QYJ5_9HYME|nr:hypothetical protein WH47_00742 [Habropoda laboriosa]